jgi:hypothetical protein
MRRIVVTGMGAVTPLVPDIEASWSRLLAGRSGIRWLAGDVVRDLPAKIGGGVPSVEEDAEAGFDPNAVIAPKDQRKVDRFLVRRTPQPRCCSSFPKVPLRNIPAIRRSRGMKVGFWRIRGVEKAADE